MKVSRKEFDELKEKIEKLHDEFYNGIKYNEEENYYYLVWTERQIEKAKQDADEMLKKLNWS